MRIGLFIAFGWMSLCTVAVAAELGDPIDLSNFAEMDSGTWPVDEDLPIEEAAFGQKTAARRFYISGIIGDSYEDFSYKRFGGSDRVGSVLTAGGAAGISFARQTGALRLEFEGRGRGDATYAEPFFDDFATERFGNNWSTLINAWRDLAITERLGIYAGGGLGAGGFCRTFDSRGSDLAPIYGSQAVTTFAWQGGGGVIYQLSNRVTLDFGYRFYGLQTSHLVRFDVPIGDVEWLPTTLSASDFLLSVRLYEPFRRWW